MTERIRHCKVGGHVDQPLPPYADDDGGGDDYRPGPAVAIGLLVLIALIFVTLGLAAAALWDRLQLFTGA